MFFGSVEKPPRLSEFELTVPEKLIAKEPLKKRDDCKLMVLNREEQTIEHRKFKNVIDYFNKGDVMVMNNTRVYPARLYATKDKSEAKVEVFLLRELADDLWEAMVKPARKVRIGNKLWFSKKISCDVIDNTISGGRVLRFDQGLDGGRHICPEKSPDIFILTLESTGAVKHMVLFQLGNRSIQGKYIAGHAIGVSGAFHHLGEDFEILGDDRVVYRNACGYEGVSFQCNLPIGMLAGVLGLDLGLQVRNPFIN